MPDKIVVQGLWHLGCVTAACCAAHFNVVGLDFDAAVVDRLNAGRAPLLEPGLDDAIAAGLAAHRLSFTADAAAACAGAGLLWLCYDTAVNDRDESDAAFVLAQLDRALGFLPSGAMVLISSQLPVGTCARLEARYPDLRFACSPENLRLGKALAAFTQADRVVVGVRRPADRPLFDRLFAPFTGNVQFVRTESAEMLKHALNSFLALSIAFINEIARLGEAVGADAREVAAALKSEPRIGPRAYLTPGGPFAGGTLARDVVTLTALAREHGETVAVIPAIYESNHWHRGWAFRRLQARLGAIGGRRIAILGLAYTPGTDTLRRSAAVELCHKLIEAGATVVATDPALHALPPDLAAVTLAPGPADAAANADALVVCTEWPQFRELDWNRLARSMRSPIVVDANRFLEKELAAAPAVEHIFVGQAGALSRS